MSHGRRHAAVLTGSAGLTGPRVKSVFDFFFFFFAASLALTLVSNSWWGFWVYTYCLFTTVIGSHYSKPPAYFGTVDRLSRYDGPISQTLKSVFNKFLPVKEDHCGHAVASAWSTLLLLGMRDYFNMRANLSSGLLSLCSPAVVCEGNTMFLFVVPREFLCVPPQSPSPAITYLQVPRCVGECVYVCERVVCRCVYWTIYPIPSTQQAPSSSPPSPTVNQMAGQFGNSIKAPRFLWLWLWLWWWRPVFISTIWWNPGLKLTGVEQVQYRGRWRIPVMSPQRAKYRPPNRRMGCFSTRSSRRTRSNFWLLDGSGAPQRPLCREGMIYGC